MEDEPKTTGTEEKTQEKFAFTAEVQKLLEILIHSLYTQKDIFLRELLSNAADALDKVHFRMLTEKNLRGDQLPLEISIAIDKDKKLLTISDTGIGMSRQELIENIGTIAHSGSLSFLRSLEKNQGKPGDLNLIGQFGVGFYSVFMAAQKVEVLTLPADPASGAHLWCCEGGGEYTIVPAEKETRGTDVRVYLKEDAGEFLESYRIEEVVRRYSDFVSYPIRMDKKQLNKASAIWRRSKSEIKEEEYEEYFKYLTHIQEKPLSHLHLSFDAPMQFRSILFIPRSVPWDLRFEVPEKWRGVHLYARRVFIQSDCEELLPVYLRFVRGVVDSDDLPLNISRETLQENALIPKIRKNLVKKVLDEMEEMAKDRPDDYKTLWRNFGKFVKQGYRMDYENRERLAGLFRFNSSRCRDEEDLIALDDYMTRMPEGQKEIYYATGENRAAIEKSPHLEIFKRKGLEVLYLTDPVDDFLFEDLREYKEKKFAAVDREGLNLDEVKSGEEQKEAKDAGKAEELTEREINDLLGFFKNTLKDRVTDVRLSKRLTGSPCCLVSGKDAPGVGMQKLMKMMNDKYEMPRRTLEINREHPIISAMAKIYVQSPTDLILPACCHQLLDNALLIEGSPLDTRNMVPRIQEMMERMTQLLKQPV